MEYLNSIELQGYIGSIRIITIDDTRVAHFSLATCYMYKSNRGDYISETTWHNITAWEGQVIEDLSRLEKGCIVSVTGRVRNQRYTSSDETERTFNEVLANKLCIIKGAEDNSEAL